ncbi:hypothetical protein V5799_020091 [Amblyomma americanum]|uniref:Uncharacterized protein n=1 Tax=Amblyomma americanum TaxID=6943 RepID=A0AAQ4EUU0_AMBAM
MRVAYGAERNKSHVETSGDFESGTRHVRAGGRHAEELDGLGDLPRLRGTLERYQRRPQRLLLGSRKRRHGCLRVAGQHGVAANAPVRALLSGRLGQGHDARLRSCVRSAGEPRRLGLDAGHVHDRSAAAVGQSFGSAEHLADCSSGHQESALKRSG